MRIRNANIYTEEHRFVRGDAAVENGRFVSCTGDPAGEEAVVDAEGMYLIPGLVDIHFHGCKGADMCDGTKEALDVITAYEASVGVTSVCPATMTIPKDEQLEVMKNAGSYEYSGGSHLVGINMEGPFISPAKKGAQAAENIMHCDYEYFSRLQKAANGLIKLVDIAPEEPGAMEFIDRAKGEVVISLAHTIHQIRRRSGDRAVMQGSQIASDGNRLSSKSIFTILQACCTHTVTDQDHAVSTKHRKCCTDH